MLGEEVQGARPGELGAGLVVATGGVVVEAVVDLGIDECLVVDVIGLQRALVIRPSGVDALIELGEVQHQGRLDLLDVGARGCAVKRRGGVDYFGEFGGEHIADVAPKSARIFQNHRKVLVEQ